MLCNPHGARFVFDYLTFSFSLFFRLTIFMSVKSSYRPPCVIEPPRIIEKPEVVTVTQGDPVSVECRVGGTPHIKVKWSKDGRELLPGRKNKLHFEKNLSSCKILSTLQEDGGNYLFEAENSVGKCSCLIKLNVVGQ